MHTANDKEDDVTGSGAVDGAITGPLTWDDICEQFHEIRVRAHAHSLQDDWRMLVTEPGTPTTALLPRWQRLVDEIERLDAGRDDSVVRHGDDIAEEADEETDSAWLDEWEPAGEQFGCPGDLCRRVRTADLMPPKCWLLGRNMKPVPPSAQTAPEGTH
ncbi:hypothetical protein ACIF8T_38235 [Streptomyces sp. NPDC085946]|uniref:hypothetical protein n=1 Tax=Streptomyces sp. NPDC085946 TaxID=3365744 RepID=UPI0037D2F035